MAAEASLTATGIDVPRSVDIRDGILDEIEDVTGEPVDRARLDQRIDGIFASILGDRLDDVYQLAQDLHDSRSVNNAQGRQLDDLCEIVGVFRRPATYSSVTVTLAGAEGTVIPVGKLVEGGGDDGKARWTISEDATIPVAGVVDVVAVAVDAGPVRAEIGDVDKIVNAVTGWTGVTNAAAATVGQARESDAELRVRRLQSLARPGAGTTDSIRAALLALSYVEGVVALSNNQITPATVQGIPLNGASLAIYVHPSTLTAAQLDELAATIWSKAPAGIEREGTQSATVTDAAGGQQVVRWSWASTVAITVDATVVLAPGYVLEDVEEPIADVVIAYFDALALGATVRSLALSAGVADKVPGVVAVSWSLDGGGPNVDFSPSITEIATTSAGSITVST